MGGETFLTFDSFFFYQHRPQPAINKTVSYTHARFHPTITFFFYPVISVDDGSNISGGLSGGGGTHHPCKACPAVFTTRAALRRHLGEIHGQGASGTCVCDQCGKLFQTKSNLKIHLLTHSGVKPFK